MIESKAEIAKKETRHFQYRTLVMWRPVSKWRQPAQSDVIMFYVNKKYNTLTATKPCIRYVFSRRLSFSHLSEFHAIFRSGITRNSGLQIDAYT